MERLWAPWRMEYIRSAHDEVGCLFCEAPARGDDSGSLILVRSGLAFAMLNAYPYNPGHVMVAPLRHEGALEALLPEEMAECSALLQRVTGVLRADLSPDGFNLGMNLGRVAGAGVPDHVHWHVVPRWNGDTNFMPVVGATRVLPEALEDTHRRLAARFAATDGD